MFSPGRVADVLPSEVTGCSRLRSEITGCSALLDPAETLAGRSALPELLEAAVLPLLVAAAGCPALPELLEAAEEKKLRSAVAGRSALLQLVGGSALSELLGAAEAGRFMAALRKMQS